jgi:trehalose 6-phosphate synthase/phosphatase
MTTFQDLKNYFESQKIRTIMVADAETVVLKREDGRVVSHLPSGGVSIALDPIAKASSAVYIGRAKTPDERKFPQAIVEDEKGKYLLKRLFFDPNDFEGYYNGFSNQTLWPLCHVAFEAPIFHSKWYESFVRVNQKYAQAVKEEIKGKTFVWLNDYQLCLVPRFLGVQKNTTIGLFWHIPWPTWEAFRILPQKKEILESLLACDFIGFHRGYHVRNFLNTVAREFEVRIDEETDQIYFRGHTTTVKNLPLGIDTDVVGALVKNEHKEESGIAKIFSKFFGAEVKKELAETPENKQYDEIFNKYQVMLGVDRLDYTKGLMLRMEAIDRFFETNKKYIEKVVYLGILAPSRDTIPSYKRLKEDVEAYAAVINKKYGKNGWQPIHLLYNIFTRKDIINFYMKADLCLVTPRDDGMNLVSKEFVAAAALSKNPGMIVLSQFAGSAIDLTSALIINPYDTNELVNAIKTGLEMDQREKTKRIKAMAKILEERNVYEWALEFSEECLSVRPAK